MKGLCNVWFNCIWSDSTFFFSDFWIFASTLKFYCMQLIWNLRATRLFSAAKSLEIHASMFPFFSGIASGKEPACQGNGNPLQCSCLENPRDGGAWWAAIYGVAQSWTRLKWLSSSSSSSQYRRFKSCDSISGSGRFPTGGHGNPLQYSCLESPMDRGAWRAVVHSVTKSQTTEGTLHGRMNISIWALDT